MTIRREVDWFGRMISRCASLSGVPEPLVKIGLFGGKAITVEVDQPDTLTYSVFSARRKSWSGELDLAERFDIQVICQEDLIGTEINQVDVTSGRRFWGIRVRYRWYQDGPNLSVLPRRQELE